MKKRIRITVYHKGKTQKTNPVEVTVSGTQKEVLAAIADEKTFKTVWHEPVLPFLAGKEMRNKIKAGFKNEEVETMDAGGCMIGLAFGDVIDPALYLAEIEEQEVQDGND